MQTECVLQWQMHSGDTFISFAAQRTEIGYGMVVKRDHDALLISDTAADGAALLEKSQSLRAVLREMGYSPKPGAFRSSHLPGGLCWGPATPLNASVLQALR
jgi:hypothetical protein